MKKIGIWIILILTSLALVVPSIAILWSIFKSEPKQITVDTENITIHTQESKPSEDNKIENNQTTTPTPINK